RARLTETARVLLGETQAHNDDFLMQIHNAYAEPIARAEAAQRLKTAAEWMDEAAIFTIHGFCYRLLRQHAFESGSLFDTEIPRAPATMNTKLPAIIGDSLLCLFLARPPWGCLARK